MCANYTWKGMCLFQRFEVHKVTFGWKRAGRAVRRDKKQLIANMSMAYIFLAIKWQITNKVKSWLLKKNKNKKEKEKEKEKKKKKKMMMMMKKKKRCAQKREWDEISDTINNYILSSPLGLLFAPCLGGLYLLPLLCIRA